MESQSDGGIPVGHVTLLHQCKGHARSVEAVDVSTDRSKVSVMTPITLSVCVDVTCSLVL